VEASRRAYCERLGFPDLRHAFASLMIASSANPRQLAEALGHSDQTGRPDPRSFGSATATSIQDRHARPQLPSSGT
jgi:integrase